MPLVGPIFDYLAEPAGGIVGSVFLKSLLRTFANSGRDFQRVLKPDV
jgi:hypothetical protein